MSVASLGGNAHLEHLQLSGGARQGCCRAFGAFSPRWKHKIEPFILIDIYIYIYIYTYTILERERDAEYTYIYIYIIRIILLLSQ